MPRVCWVAEFTRADGTAAGRWEYFMAKSEERADHERAEENARRYAAKCNKNGARVRVFRMEEQRDK